MQKLAPEPTSVPKLTTIQILSRHAVSTAVVGLHYRLKLHELKQSTTNALQCTDNNYTRSQWFWLIQDMAVSSYLP
jgi:hypothetical protein